jgi:hypothetical protein
MVLDVLVVVLLVLFPDLVVVDPCHDTETEATALPVWNPLPEVAGTTTRCACPLHV